MTVTMGTAATTTMSTGLAAKGRAMATSNTAALQQLLLQFQAHVNCVHPGLVSCFVMYTDVMLL